MHFHLTPLEIEKRETIEWILDPNNNLEILSRLNITRAELAAFTDGIEGRVVYPWSPLYPVSKKEFNDVYPAFPAMIIYAASYTDIRKSLKIGIAKELDVAVRSGGHSYADYSVCDGVVIDVSHLKGYKIDQAEMTLWTEVGMTFKELNSKLELYGLHLPGGGCPTVAVAGFMMGGGYSLTSRMFGIQSDVVREFEMMLADGSIVVANATQNADLFWAVRGGTGGNFGVLLNITYNIFSLPKIWGVKIAWSFEDDTSNAAKALYTIQEQYLQGSGHQNLGIETYLYTNNGVKTLQFGAGFNGSETELNQVLAPLMNIPGAQLQTQYDVYSVINNWVLEGVPDVPMDVKYFGRSTYFERKLSVEDYRNILEKFKTAPNDWAMVDMEGYGGKIRTYPVEDSSFVHRDVLMDFLTIVFFDPASNDREQNREWLNSFYDEFLPEYSNGHTYQNYPSRDQEGWQWAYWGPYYNQLVEIKKKYNPNNLFDFQQAIGSPIDPDHEKDQIMLFEETPIVYEAY